MILVFGMICFVTGVFCGFWATLTLGAALVSKEDPSHVHPTGIFTGEPRHDRR